MNVRTVSLNEVPISDKPTHIVIYQGDAPLPSVQAHAEAKTTTNDNTFLLKKIDDMNNRLTSLYSRVLSLEEKRSANANTNANAKPSPFFSSALSPSPDGLDIMRLSESAPTHPTTTLFNTLVAKAVTEVAEAKVDAEAKEEEEAEEEAEEEEEDAEEEESEAVELEEFEYKGETYYRDSENQVYRKDDDGDLDDTPIGVWNAEKNKLLKYPS